MLSHQGLPTVTHGRRQSWYLWYTHKKTQGEAHRHHAVRWGIQAHPLPDFAAAGPAICQPGSCSVKPLWSRAGSCHFSTGITHSCGICLFSVPGTHPVIGCSPEIISKKGQLDLRHVCLTLDVSKHQLMF